MKNKKYVFIMVTLMIFAGILLVWNGDSDNITLDEVKLKEETKVNRKQFAVYIRNSKNEKYKEYNEDNLFPVGYKLDSEQSGCMDNNGDEVDTTDVISQTNDGKIMVTSTKTVYCTFYFDKPKLFVPEDYVSDDKELANGGYLIYHDGKEGQYSAYEAGDNSYRFAGNNPDNYVCLDGSDDATGNCSDIKKLYRVIGWFQNEDTTEYQMKIIKSEYITANELGGNLTNSSLTKSSYSDYISRVDVTNIDGFHWSGGGSINYNNWIKSKLNETLNSTNGKYLQSLSSYTDIIDETNWYIGGNALDNITKQTSMKDAYENELGNKKLTVGTTNCTDTNTTKVPCTKELLYQKNKVGLMYATEYGYASAPGNWNKKLGSGGYDAAENRSSNWLFNGEYEWILSRQADSTDNALYVEYSGSVYGNYNVYYQGSYGVRPVLVLKSNATIKSGDGSKERPWRIELQNS